MNNKKTTIALAASAALSAGLALSPMMASADANPFASAELSSGYMQLAEGNCGGDMKKGAEAKCGAEKKATKEGKCGEAKCGADKKAAKEGKCGEAKCGADKKAEGKCGEAKCGAKAVDKAFLSNNPSYNNALGK
tara:strand:+ start:1296 stop:1700 length:405 start_codon:yes stop_codon:yes gene_type:complete